MDGSDRWARVAAALPLEERARREGPFWQALVTAWGWRQVVDAGCGSGFHLELLRRLGVNGVGFDATRAALPEVRASPLAVADLLAPPLRSASFDAALCLGNTFSLLPSRAAQRHAINALGDLVRTGGVVLLQGEDVGTLGSGRSVARTRTLPGGDTHLRVFRRRGGRVEMLAGVLAPAGDTDLEATLMLPTSAARVAGYARVAGFRPVGLPAEAPASSAATWWLALEKRGPGGVHRRP